MPWMLWRLALPQGYEATSPFTAGEGGGRYVAAGVQTMLCVTPWQTPQAVHCCNEGTSAPACLPLRSKIGARGVVGGVHLGRTVEA